MYVRKWRKKYILRTQNKWYHQNDLRILAAYDSGYNSTTWLIIKQWTSSERRKWSNTTYKVTLKKKSETILIWYVEHVRDLPYRTLYYKQSTFSFSVSHFNTYNCLAAENDSDLVKQQPNNQDPVSQKLSVHFTLWITVCPSIYATLLLWTFTGWPKESRKLKFHERKKKPLS